MRISAHEARTRADRLFHFVSPCRLCPHRCGADRQAGEMGRCGIDAVARIASFGPHFGEESILVGEKGSGTVFFSGCNLDCSFCQNWEISHQREGVERTEQELADVYLRLQEMGCHNLNLVTPTHQAHAIVGALAVALERGFDLPVVWNCGGYESVEVLRILDGVVDVYMPDVKYGDDCMAERLSGAPAYVRVSQAAIREMHRQVGDLEITADGIAQRGLLVRHLVLPEGLAGTGVVVRFLAEEVSRDTYVNIMGQYHPCFRADEIPELRREVTVDEHAKALALARRVGLHRFAL